MYRKIVRDIQASSQKWKKKNLNETDSIMTQESLISLWYYETESGELKKCYNLMTEIFIDLTWLDLTQKKAELSISHSINEDFPKKESV